MNRFISGNVWNELRAAVKKSTRPAAVAVAYFSKGASKLLQLPKASQLVVDASESAVKSGQTCPADLKHLLLKRKILIYSMPNLHAKVFVIGSTAFIGSANASNRSANSLIEALIATSDSQAVGSARNFVRGLCLQELGPEELDRLQRIYSPPLIPTSFGAKRSSKNRGLALDPLRIVQLERGDLPVGAARVRKEGAKAAKKRMISPMRHMLDDFHWTGQCPFHAGQNIVQIVAENSGRRLVDPPARVVYTKVWQNGATKLTFVYLERAKKRRIEIARLARKIGKGARKRLLRNGIVSKRFAVQLLTALNS